MSTEDRLHRLMSTVGQNDVDPGSWSDFVAVAHRHRSRHQIITTAGALAAVVLVSLGTAAVLNLDRAEVDIPPSDRNVVPVPLPEDVPSDCPTAPEFTEGPLGTVAYLGATELHVLDVATGEDWILVQGGAGFGEGLFTREVRISPDGRWVSFGGGLMVPTAGGEVCAPLGEGVHDLEWGPDGRIVALSDGEPDGELVVGGVHETAVGHSYGGYPFKSLALSPDGHLAAVAAIPPDVRVSDHSDESSEWRENLPGLWVIDLEASSDEVLKFSPLLGDQAGIEIAGWSPDGQWILFWNTYDAPSLDADGSPLRALEIETGDVVTITDAMISERDQMTWCAGRLVFTDGGGRGPTQDEKVIASTEPPGWVVAELHPSDFPGSYVDPACDEGGKRLAATRAFTDGVGLSSLILWTEGTDQQTEIRPSGKVGQITGYIHPKLSEDGSTVVVEVMAPNMGGGDGANELLVISGTERTILGLLGSPSSFVHVGGSPSWDWHRP